MRQVQILIPSSKTQGFATITRITRTLQSARFLTKSLSLFLVFTLCVSYQNRNAFRYVASRENHPSGPNSNFRDHYARSQTIATIPRLTRTCSKETQGWVLRQNNSLFESDSRIGKLSAMWWNLNPTLSGRKQGFATITRKSPRCRAAPDLEWCDTKKKVCREK